MADTEIQYLGKYATEDSLDNPSAVIRRITSDDVYIIEICNKMMPWREDIELERHFFGISGDAVEIAEELALKTVAMWQKGWFIQ